MGIKMTIIPVGWGDNDAGYNFVGYNFATKDNDYKREAGWMRFPLLCVLIQHPTEGNILFDVGCGPDEHKDRRPAEHTNVNPAIISREEYIDERLKQIGMTVSDIDKIIISHCHWDHIGGLEFFKGTKAIKNVYVPMKDYAYALMQSHRSSRGYSDTFYYRRNLDVEGADFNLVEEDTVLCDGIEMLLFEGHTPRVIGLIVHLDSGTYILPSDAIASGKGYYEPTTKPATIYDTLGYARTIKRIRYLEKKYNAKIIFPHDPWLFKDYKTIPEYYE